MPALEFDLCQVSKKELQKEIIHLETAQKLKSRMEEAGIDREEKQVEFALHGLTYDYQKQDLHIKRLEAKNSRLSEKMKKLILIVIFNL